LPLKVTLAWSDPASSTSASKNLVNDLVVTAPDGTQYLGNVFGGGWSHSGGSADRVNNLENVYVQSPAAGTGCSSFAKIGQTSTNVLTYSETTAVPSTTYSCRVQAVNTGGASDYSNTATTTTPATPQLHVADLDGSTATSKNTWTASVTITINDVNSAPVSGATVSGTWSGGFFGGASCNTAGGTCKVTRGI
jgi:hypothetical protein